MAAEGGAPHGALDVVDGRQWGRDRLAAEGCVGRFWVWSGDRASMGPRPFGRGRCLVWLFRVFEFYCVNGAATVWPRKDADHSHASPPAFQRQWGRDRLAAEGRPTRRVGRRPATASMGPRPFGRGRHGLGMGGGAGRRRQWGRDRLAAEGSLALAMARSAAWRQWGRDRLAAEGSLDAAQDRSDKKASMGPRPFGRGRRYISFSCRLL